MTKSPPLPALHIGKRLVSLLLGLLIVLGSFRSNAALAQAEAGLNAADVTDSQTATLTSTVRRVSVDVVVTDLKGRSVTGLKQSDFSVEEDSVPQPIKSFEGHTDAFDARHVASQLPPLPPSTFLNFPKALDPGPPAVVLYDALNTSIVLQADAEQQFLRFLKQRRTGAPVAIFVLSDRLHLIQGFTEPLTPQAAQKALERFAGAGRWRHPRSRDRRVAATLVALTQIGRFLASMPGRKNLIWYSSGFPESILPHETGGRNPDTFAPPNYSEAIRQVTDLLNLSHVAIYPVDVRGVRADPTYSAALSGELGRDFGTGPVILLNMRRDFIALDTAVRSTMNTLADDTGGHAYYGTNDLKGALAEAMLNGSTYYSLTYEPTNPKYDGSLRHIKVTLKNVNYNLSYRRRYFADDLDAKYRTETGGLQSLLLRSLERGMPLSSGLIVEAHLEPSGPAAPATPVQLQKLSQYQSMQPGDDSSAVAKGAPLMMQTYLISYGLIARQLEMPANAAGERQALLEFAAIAYDDDGRKLIDADTRVEDTIQPERYAKVERNGYHVAQEVAIPVAASLIRLTVRDVRSDRIGSLEVVLPLVNVGETPLPKPAHQR